MHFKACFIPTTCNHISNKTYLEMQKILLIITILFVFTLVACGGGTTSDSDTDSTATSDDSSQTVIEEVVAENVFVMPIRKVKAGVSIEDFKAARDAYVALLEAEEGTLSDREMQPFFDFTYSGMALDSIYVGFTSFQNFEIFKAIGDKTNGPEAEKFFGTFDFLAFEVMQPLNGEVIDLATLAPKGSEQVWEIAMRDISKYENFDQADYEQKRDAYLEILAQQKGFVKEIQWQSVSDPNVVIGMTIYENGQAVQDINSNQDFIDAYKATGFIDDYPPNKFGMISNVLK